MLGIRRYRGVAIDLFQGGPELFVADAWIDAAHPVLEHGLGGMVAALVAIDEQRLRHAAIRPDSLALSVAEAAKGELDAARLAALRATTAEAWMAAVSSFLDGERVEAGLARLTFLLPDKAWYTSFRDTLFQSFADTP